MFFLSSLWMENNVFAISKATYEVPEAMLICSNKDKTCSKAGATRAIT